MKHTSLLTLTLLLPAVSYAQNADSIPSLEDHQLGHRLIYTGQNDNVQASDDSIRSMIDLFYIDQFRHFQDPRAPYFLFMSKNKKKDTG